MVKNIENLLQPTVDYVFKRIFGHVGNERITKSLLTAILNEEIRNIVYLIYKLNKVGKLKRFKFPS